MFDKKTSHGRSESFPSKYRAGKSTSRAKRSFREHATSSCRSERDDKPVSPPIGSTLTSAIVTICVGPEQRLFAAHENVLCVSPFFAACCRGQFLESHSKRINLPDEQPEVLSCVLEYLYKGDYYPRLVHNKRRNTWELEDEGMDIDGETKEATILHQTAGTVILKDTAVYCAAEKYNLPELKRLALRKQGLQSGIQCSTILSSARYAYANTPDTDSKLRAHYLALIIRSRSTFKRSGTMQMEMEQGGKLFFDLFVAMCNHMDDLTAASKSPFSR
ncbi:hypothetical protein VTN77DRAFT_4247 [Rasamsonia byssochlamydoides]|uniref:uncharacterized protein n=1 Tax=Rasamsonia byssochlamydoides TaxID=89139 RepID=UPI0037441C7B